MTKNKIIYRLKDGKKPISWQLPLSNVFLPRTDDNGNVADKLVHYLPGAPSIWVEDYKGAKSSEEIWLENGELEVSATNKLLIEILENHRWNNLYYERVDTEADAVSQNNKFDSIQTALQLVENSDDLKVQANALILIGSAANAYSPVRCRAELKKLAFEDPEKIIVEMKAKDFKSKHLVSLALLHEVILKADGDTSIIWGDTKKSIVRVAAGEDPIEELAKLISKENEVGIITKQRLGELTAGKEGVKQAYVPSTDATAKILQSKDKEIEELKAKLAASNKPAPTPVMDQVVVEELDEQEEETTDGKKSIEELTIAYRKMFNKDVPPNMRNNYDWIATKINS
jgi:hypothetical protein